MTFTFLLIYNEWRWEKILGIKTLAIAYLKSHNLKGLSEGAHHYQGASYYILNQLLKQLKGIEKGGFMDYGCGKGRALIFAAYHGFKSVYGIDLSQELCSQALININNNRQNFNPEMFKVFHENALDFDLPDEVNVVYLFNPFDSIVLTNVTNKLEESLIRRPRKLYVIYVNPIYTEVLEVKGYSKQYVLRSKKYIEGIIYTK